MNRSYLLSYKPDTFQALNSNGFTYILKIRRTMLWGLVERTIDICYTVPDHHSLKSYTDNWDKIIETKQPINYVGR